MRRGFHVDEAFEVCVCVCVYICTASVEGVDMCECANSEWQEKVTSACTLIWSGNTRTPHIDTRLIPLRKKQQQQKKPTAQSQTVNHTQPLFIASHKCLHLLWKWTNPSQSPGISNHSSALHKNISSLASWKKAILFLPVILLFWCVLNLPSPKQKTQSRSTAQSEHSLSRLLFFFKD